jgi:hypothetical protein
MVYWNLAGGRGAGTAMVSGYSQGMLKAFLESGEFEDEEETEVELVGEDGCSAFRLYRVLRCKGTPIATSTSKLPSPCFHLGETDWVHWATPCHLKRKFKL